MVFGHVNESSSQAEMREDKKHLLQDPVHLVQMLERKDEQNEIQSNKAPHVVLLVNQNSAFAMFK